MDDLIKQAAEYLKQARFVTVFTGAGISAESGIPTYRDKQTGLWEKYDPKAFATSMGFLAQPDIAWQWYKFRREEMGKAQPNPAHLQVARLQKLKPHTEIITQNIDDLHEKAGGSNINHLHGSIYVNHCYANCQGTPTVLDTLSEDHDIPPKCPHCGGLVRPGVVWFGEMLSVDAVQAMRQRVAITDLLLVIGLSGAITYGVPDHVKVRNRGRVIEVNPSLSGITVFSDIFLSAPAGEVMPKLMDTLEELL